MKIKVTSTNVYGTPMGESYTAPIEVETLLSRMYGAVRIEIVFNDNSKIIYERSE